MTNEREGVCVGCIHQYDASEEVKARASVMGKIFHSY
jgi:hypothetical protein